MNFFFDDLENKYNDLKFTNLIIKNKLFRMKNKIYEF